MGQCPVAFYAVSSRAFFLQQSTATYREDIGNVSAIERSCMMLYDANLKTRKDRSVADSGQKQESRESGEQTRIPVATVSYHDLEVPA